MGVSRGWSALHPSHLMFLLAWISISFCSTDFKLPLLMLDLINLFAGLNIGRRPLYVRSRLSLFSLFMRPSQRICPNEWSFLQKPNDIRFNPAAIFSPEESTSSRGRRVLIVRGIYAGITNQTLIPHVGVSRCDMDHHILFSRGIL